MILSVVHVHGANEIFLMSTNKAVAFSLRKVEREA